MSHVLLCQGTALALPLRDASVACCVTSPPYLSLRDYGIPGQLGLESSIDEYVANLVQVFREVKRVLRDDGTCWINLGDTFAGGTIRSDVRYSLECLMKGQPLIFRHGVTIGITSQSTDVTLQDNRFPYGELFSLFGIERITVKQRDNDFCQVLHTLAMPSYYWIDAPMARYTIDATHMEIILDSGYRPRIVISDHDTDMQAIFRILRTPRTRTGKDGDTPLTIKEAAQPIPECVRDSETIGDAITVNTPLKRFPDIYFVNDPIAFQDRFGASPGECANFRVTQASEQQCTFTLDQCGIELTTTMVRHLYSLNDFGSFVHYTELYKKAIQKANASRPKQELGIPDLVKRALMEDGWICRSTIIWHKLNPMPESVQDRPTRAHEQVFLLSKQARYFFDMDAVREPHNEAYAQRRLTPPKPQGISRMWTAYPNHGLHETPVVNGHPNGRACRSVWPLASEPTGFQHYAAFPQALVRRCLLAGAPSQVCAACGAPYQRSRERTQEVAASHNGSRFDVGKSAHHGHVQEGVRYVSTPGALEATCACSAGVAKAVILDPFVGSGTTLLVARELGHHAIGVDLSYPYLHDISRERLGLAALKEWTDGQKSRQECFDDLPLFAP